MSDFWDRLIEEFGTGEEIIGIPGAPLVTNKLNDKLQKRALLPQISRFSGKTAVDIGTGVGRWARFLSKDAELVVGIDISAKMIRIAKKRVRKENISYIRATASALPLRSESMDLSLTCTCLEHIVILEELSAMLQDAALCAMGQQAPNPVLSTLKHFRDEYEIHIKEKKCPAGVCKIGDSKEK